jgi:hypothetical protein
MCIDLTMEGTTEYWKSRALTAEDAFRQIQSELRKERKERKEFEALLIQKFDQFCQSTEDRLVAEMKHQQQSQVQSTTNNTTITTSSVRTGEDLVTKRSNTPTPRRAAPVPPPKRAFGP